MCNLGDPELLRGCNLYVEPVCGTLGTLNFEECNLSVEPWET